MSMFSWAFGDTDRETASLRFLADRMEELHEWKRRAYMYESAYRDLRRELTSRACRNGRDSPSIEPLASILREHDDSMKARGYDDVLC